MIVKVTKQINGKIRTQDIWARERAKNKNGNEAKTTTSLLEEFFSLYYEETQCKEKAEAKL